VNDVILMLFVLYVFVLVPRGALRSRRLLRAAAAPGEDPTRPAPPSRTRVLLGTLFMLCVLYLLT
jgi:hypothetical protein